MTNLVLIRHGETEWNVTGRYQGQANPPLNENGRNQAHKLADKLAAIGLDLLISSPLQRAAQTATIIASQIGVPCVFDDRLVEIHQGDWQTRLRSEIESLYPDLFHRWMTTPWEVTPPGGENLEQVQVRVTASVEDILCQYPQQIVGIVTHRVPIALIKLRFQDLDPDIVRTLHLPNAYFESLIAHCVREKPIGE
jgi:broad specificity phosphatase PhoE